MTTWTFNHFDDDQKTLRERFTEEARRYWAGDMPQLAPLTEPEFALLVADNDNHSRKVET